MRVKTETNELGTHYEFICYYEHKRVALIEQTLDELLHKNEVKVIGWLVYHKIDTKSLGFINWHI